MNYETITLSDVELRTFGSAVPNDVLEGKYAHCKDGLRYYVLPIIIYKDIVATREKQLSYDNIAAWSSNN